LPEIARGCGFIQLFGGTGEGLSLPGTRALRIRLSLVAGSTNAIAKSSAISGDESEKRASLPEQEISARRKSRKLGTKSAITIL
jgi:hypothetical protein